MRHRIVLISAIVLVDTIFFAALTPLLPHYAATLGLSKSDAGVLTGAFAVGALLSALPSGPVTSRLGVRATVLLGLGLMSVTSLVFGLAKSFWVLVLTRFAGGIGSACSWTAAVSWLTAGAPRERRGELIGVTLSAAVAGALLGPVLGSLAAAIGTGPAFAFVALSGVALAAWVWTTSSPGMEGAEQSLGMFAALGEPALRAGIGLILLPPLLFGALQVLAPLELSRLGWSAAMLGGVYVVTAAVEAVVHPLLGRWSDRRGYLEPVSAGLAGSVGVLLALAWADAAWPLASLVVLAGVAFGATLVPGMSLLSKTGEALGLGGAPALALANFAWALGNAIGAPLSGRLADVSGDAAAYVTLAAICLAGLALVRWQGRVAHVKAIGLLAALLWSVSLGAAAAQTPPSRVVILSTTTSTQDSGLLDVLVPMFEKQSGYSVKTISVGTGQALALAARGEADVTLAHAPALEKQYVSDGKMQNRRLVMYNDFVIIGPPDDPAKIRGLPRAVEALKRIAATRSRFVSRGDKSGTHSLELALWKQAGIEPQGSWYIESGQGMGQTLGIANERGAYTVTDRATLLAFRQRVTLPILVEKDRPLLNIYSVMEVNPANGPRVNPVGGKAFADFMVSPTVQAVIKTFGVDKYGQPLFVPIAGKTEEEIGG